MLCRIIRTVDTPFLSYFLAISSKGAPIKKYLQIMSNQDGRSNFAYFDLNILLKYFIARPVCTYYILFFIIFLLVYFR